MGCRRGVGMLVVRTVVLIVVVVAGVWIYYQLRQNPHPPPPAPAKAVVPGTEKPKAVGSPEPGFLVEHAKDLGLSKEQVAKLKKDAAAFDRTTAPLRKQLDEAGKAVAAELNKLTGRQVKLPDMQERTKLYSDLSGKLAQLRRAAWQEEQKILTPEQRKKAVEEWSKVHQLFGGKPEAGKKSPGGGG